MAWFWQKARRKDPLDLPALTAKQLSTVWTSSVGECQLDRDAVSVAREFHKNLYLWSCVSKIITTAAVPPLYVATADDRKPSAYEQKILAVIERPNPQWSRQHLVEFVTLCLATTMRAYLKIVRGVGKVPLELWPLDPTRVTLDMVENSSIIRAFVYQNGLQKEVYPVAPDGSSDIIYIHRANLDPTKPAAAPAQVAVPPSEVFNRILQKAADVASNSANVTGILSTETDVDQKSVEAIRDRIDDFKTGRRQSGDTLVIANAKWTFSRLTEEPSTILSVEIKDSLARDVCAVMGVPTQLVSLPGSQTFANYEMALQAFITETICPMYLGPLCSELTKSLLQTTGATLRNGNGNGAARETPASIMYDVDAWPSMVRARLSLVDVAQKASFLSINEKRQLLGYPMVDDEDADLIPALESISVARTRAEMGNPLDAIRDEAS